MARALVLHCPGMEQLSSATSRSELDLQNSQPVKYDFGDSWEHELLVEKRLPLEAGKRYPVCLTGKRACPPEDCGGIWGYASLLEAIRDPEHPEHEEMLEWVGGEFDPEAFDLDEVNRELQHLTESEERRSPR